MAERQLDIFKVLDAVNKNNPKYYDTLTEQQLKELQPFVLMRWVTGSPNVWQIQYVNELVNPYAFSLTKHKKLLFQLLTMCGPGKFQRYKWIKGTTRQPTKPHSLGLLKQFYNYSHQRAVDAMQLLQYNDIVDIAEQLGKQKEDIALIKKEWK